MNLLSDIITYVRRIVKTPSDQDISDSLIIDYINRFYLYDTPARLQLFDLKTKANFITSPFIDQYNMPYSAPLGTPNGVITYQGLMNPVYCDGIQIPLMTSRNSFFKAYPNFYFEDFPPGAVGNGGTSYTFNTSIFPIIRAHIDVLGNNNPGVYITVIDANNNQLLVTDSGLTLPTDNNTGTLIGDGTGTVNYTTGAISVTFNEAVPAGNQMQAKYVNFQAGTPRVTMFFNNIVTLRPVPDIAYLVEFDAYLTPAAFLNAQEALAFGYMSEWIARGAARKILSDTGDYEQFSFYEPLFREQENLVLRRSDRQNSVNRTPTIFTEMSSQNPFQYGSGQTI